MKKELLMTFVAFATISASAQVSVQKAPISSHRSEAFKKMNNKLADVNAFNYAPKALTGKKNIVSIKKADEKAIELTPDYSETIYRYNAQYPLAFVCQCMYEGASHKVDGNKAYLKPYADIDNALVGTFVEGDNIYSAQYGADSITFKCDEPVAFYTNEKNEKVNVYLRPSTLGYKEDFSGYEVVPTGENTFGAYYFKKYDELFVSEDVVLALYAENEDTPIDEEHTITYLDVVPQEIYKDAMMRAIVKGKCLNGASNDFVSEAAAIVSNDYLLVNGVCGINPHAWVMFLLDDEEDPNLYYVPEDLMLSSVTNNGTSYLYTTVGMKQDGNYNMVGDDDDFSYPSYYSLTENADESYTLKSAQNTAFGEYYYTNADVDNDVLRWYDLTINIYNAVPTSIASVKNSSKQENAMYNLAGQRINKLQRGINIVNGKKVVVK
ncbi:MAG: hypothetical protein J5663_12235 [Bacteroidaceae bacterium]|nr:hypothetical protein [Bacteroidaceae bacterium]